MPAFLCFWLVLIFSVLPMPAFSAALESNTSPAVMEDEQDGALRFAVNDNGTVLDNETGLMWLTDANIGKNPVPWQAANRYIQEMNNGARLNIGYTNWRLPTISDLETLVDNSQTYPALPRRHPFVNVQDDFYWSSSTGSDIVDYIWMLDMGEGSKVIDYRSYCSFRYFWPVRNTWNSTAQQGAVFTGGFNKNGQLGDGTLDSRASFMPVNMLLNGIVKAAAGMQHAIAVHADGTVWGWGDNNQGQLSDGIAARESRVPALIGGLRMVVDAAAGMYHSVALKADGTVWSWGENVDGQLGIGDPQASRTPVQVKGLSSVVKIAAGMYHTLALKSDGTVWAWGKNENGQLGIGDPQASRTPVQVKGLSNVVKIAAGMNHSIAVKSDGTVWAWGDNTSGQLGDGSRSGRHMPVQIKGVFGVIDAAAGGEHSLAVKADGTVWAWGGNKYNQVGPADATEILTVSKVEGVSTARKIAAGTYHSVVLLSDGKISVWGRNFEKYGHDAPYAVSYVKDVFEVAAGRYYTVLLSGQPVGQ